jgi:hypothetical protein
VERLKRILRLARKPKETATAAPDLERAMLPKAEKRIIRGNN